MWASAPTGERRSVGSTAARRNRGPAGGRLIAAPTVKSLPGTFDEGTPAARFACLRRGTFHRRKVPKMRRGLRPPDSRGAARHASPEAALRKPLRSTGLSRPILPAPSRLRAGQSNRSAVTATELSSKAARTATLQGANVAHGRYFARFIYFRRRGAHCASERLRYQRDSVERTGKRFCCRGRCLHRPVPRSGLSWRVRWLRKAVCSAAPRASPCTGEALARAVCRGCSGVAGQRADVGIGPYVGTAVCALGGGVPATQPGGRAIRAPTAESHLVAFAAGT